MWDQNFYFSSLCYEADRPLYRREKSITICTICSLDSGFDSLVELNIKHFFLLWSYFFLPICNFSKVHLLANHLGCLPCSSQTLPSLISTYTHTHVGPLPHMFSSVTQSCPTLCNPMNCSTPGLPVHHKVPEFAQTHAHQVGDAIQPSHPLSSPSPPAPNSSHLC